MSNVLYVLLRSFCSPGVFLQNNKQMDGRNRSSRHYGPVPKAMPLTRSWCLFEILQTINLRKQKISNLVADDAEMF